MPDEPNDAPHEHHHQRGSSGGPSPRNFFSNWSQFEGSLAEKVRLTLRNRARAYAPPFRGCCGHPGEPGC